VSKVDATATVDADTGEIVAALFGLVDALKAHFDDVAAEFGLTPTQALALRCLDEPQAMGDLARHLRCERSNVTAVGDRLEALRLVRRTTHPSDRRVTRLELTAAGHRMRADFAARLFAAVPAVAGLDDRQRRTFRDLLRRITAATTTSMVV
jgi:DNA-binding MarR family transcriptional regulator